MVDKKQDTTNGATAPPLGRLTAPEGTKNKNINMKEVWKYIQSDYYRYTSKKLSPFKLFLKAVLGTNHCFRYSFWLRMASHKNGIGGGVLG